MNFGWEMANGQLLFLGLYVTSIKAFVKYLDSRRYSTSVNKNSEEFTELFYRLLCDSNKDSITIEIIFQG